MPCTFTEEFPELCTGPSIRARPEQNLRVAFALQHLIVHLVITHATAAVAAPRIDHNFSGQLSAGIDTQVTVLHFECSAHSMEHVAQSELHRTL